MGLVNDEGEVGPMDLLQNHPPVFHDCLWEGPKLVAARGHLLVHVKHGCARKKRRGRKKEEEERG